MVLELDTEKSGEEMEEHRGEIFLLLG